MIDVEVLFSPAEFEALPRRELNGASCVVFDVLRATSSMITALAHGASVIFPVSEIDQALDLRRRKPDLLLAGERNGLRIRAADGTLFDLANSPREFSRARVSGREIAMTTTNGTRALVACDKADAVFVACFLNLSATARALQSVASTRFLLVCGGTFEEASYEDTLAAGALIELLRAGQPLKLADSGLLAWKAYRLEADDLLDAFKQSHNGRRLLNSPELAPDVEFCAERDRFDLIARLGNDGGVRSV